jgi:hypothetical protein
MNQIGNVQKNTQDSVSQINKDATVIKITDKTLKLNIERPEVKSIPEIPRKFQQRIKPASVRVRQKEFVPSPTDSVEFNLLTKKEVSGGILQNTVVDNFLEPLPRSDQEWIISQAIPETSPIIKQKQKSEQIDSAFEEAALKDTVRVLPDSIIVDSTTKILTVDTIQPVKDSIGDHSVVSGRQEMIEEIKVGESEKGFLQSGQKDILTGLLLISVAIVGVIRMTNYKYVREVFYALMFVQAARKMQKTINLRHQKTAFTLNFLFLFNASIFIYQFIAFYDINTIVGQSLLLIPLIIGILMCYALIKRLLYRFVGFVFDCQEDTGAYLFHGLISNKVFGLLIAPIIVVIPYIEAQVLPILFNIGIIGFIILYILQIFRGIGIILKNPASLFYLFLYLCALEILPLIIIYHILVN